MPNIHHEIAKKKRTRPIARLIDFIKPNYIGLKWRFFEFSIILKNASIDYPCVYVLFYIVEFLASVFPSLYVISGYNPDAQDPYPPGKAIFPFWEFFNKFVPEFIYVETWLYIQSVFFGFILVIFFICFMSPRQCYFLNIFLHIQIHLILFPLSGGAFSYDIYYFLELPSEGAGLVPTILHFVLFFFYFCLLIILFFAESNSIISAHYGVAQWFSLFPFHYPFLLFFITFTGFQMPHLDTISRHLLVFLTCLFLTVSAVFTFINMPFVLFVGNEIFFAKNITMVVIFVIGDVMLSNIMHGRRKLIFSLLPLLFVIIYFIAHYLFKLKRIVLTKFLNNLSEEDSFEPLDMNVKSASKMCITVKLSLLSGQKIVISPKFVQYCLERFPDDEWFISYVAFLYVVMWNASEDVYKFLLHMLSLDTFNIATQYTLYQFVYCFMQTSQVASPVIYRKLQKYRHLVLKFVIAHKNFWMAAVEQNYDAFNLANDQMGVLMSKIEFSIKQLKVLYPLCPVIHCERSLFEADFHHNYLKSDFFYQKASALLDHSNIYINSTFFYNYSIFFPGIQRITSTKNQGNNGSNNKEDSSSEYCYLSFFENNDNALRSSVSLSIHDPYITSLTHTFRQKKEIPKIDPKFDTTNRRIYLGIFLLLAALIFGIFVYQTSINRILNRCLDDYEEMNDFLLSTRKFRNDLNIAEFDLLLALNSTKTESIFNFSISHLDKIRKDLLFYKYKYDASENKNKEAMLNIENIIEYNASLSVIFSRINTLMLSVRSLSSIPDSNESSIIIINESEVIDRFKQAFEFIERIYYEFIDFFIDTEKSEMKHLKIHMIVIIVIEIVPPLIGILICQYLLRKTQNDVFDIVKTGQPPILYYIAHQFDKIISYQKSQYPALKQYRRPMINLPIFLIILVFFVPDLLILIMVCSNKITVPSSNSLDPILQPSITAIQVYYVMASVEMNRQDETQNFYCIHNIFNQSFKNTQKVEMSFFKYSHYLVVTSKILFIAIFALLLWFAINLVGIAKHWKIRKYMLQFIPSHISHSNPIFHELLKEGRVKNSTVKEFLSELKTPPSNFDFFCILQYDSEDSITKITGNIKIFLKKVPETLEELRLDLIHMFESEAEPINEFFRSKILNSCLSLSFGNNKDVSLSFASDPNALIIKDDHLNTENNLKQRISHHVDDYIEKRRSQTNSIDKCVLIIFEIDDQKTLNSVSEKCSLFQSLRIIDSRFNRVVVISQPVTDKVPEDFAIFLDTIRPFMANINGCALLGGPLMFFDGIKGAITKSRLMGEVYEKAKKVALEVKKGQFLIEKELASSCGIERDEIIEINLVDGNEFQGISYFE